jgi:hypothetical protein
MSPPFCTVSLITANAALQTANSANISTPQYNKGDLKQPPQHDDANGNFHSHDITQKKTRTHQTMNPTIRAAAMKLTAQSFMFNRQTVLT